MIFYPTGYSFGNEDGNGPVRFSPLHWRTKYQWQLGWYTKTLMEPADIETILKEARDLSKENNRMLKAIRRDAWISFIGRVIFWTLIIVVPGYLAYQYIAPYLNQSSGSAASQNDGTSGALQYLGFPASTTVNDVVKQFKNLGN